MRRFLLHLAIVTLASFTPAMCLAGEAQDKAAAEQIAASLRDSGKMKNYSVGVKYNGGTVWLNGKVTSQLQLTTALTLVSNFEGVERIINGIAVEPAAGGVKQTAANVPQPQQQQAKRVNVTTANQAAPLPMRTANVPATAVDPQVQPAGFHHAARMATRPLPMYAPSNTGPQHAAMDQAYMPNYAWPSYAAAPNYAAVTYPKQYSASAFPFIGPFYPYPQVPLGWRKVSLEWDDGWWFLDFYDRGHH